MTSPLQKTECLFHSFVIQTKHFHWSNRHSSLGKLSRLKNKHARKNVRASRLKANSKRNKPPLKIHSDEGLFFETSVFESFIVAYLPVTLWSMTKLWHFGNFLNITRGISAKYNYKSCY